MKNFVLSGLTLTFLFALTTGLWANDTIVARVDQEFVVAGKTLPAGTYEFVSAHGSPGLTIHRKNGHASTIVFPTFFEDTTHEHEHLTLQQVAGVSYLREIATRDGVYVLTLPRESMIAKTQEHDAMSPTGTK